MIINNEQANDLISIMNDYAEMIGNGNTDPLIALGRIAGTLERNGFGIDVNEIDGKAMFVLT